MGLFERYLSLWVALCIVVGVVSGSVFPTLFQAIAGLEYASVNLVVAVFIWVMIYPMMVNVDFVALKNVGKKPKGLCITLVVNWLIKPFSMAALVRRWRPCCSVSPTLLCPGRHCCLQWCCTF